MTRGYSDGYETDRPPPPMLPGHPSGRELPARPPAEPLDRAEFEDHRRHVRRMAVQVLIGAALIALGALVYGPFGAVGGIVVAAGTKAVSFVVDEFRQRDRPKPPRAEHATRRETADRPARRGSGRDDAVGVSAGSAVGPPPPPPFPPEAAAPSPSPTLPVRVDPLPPPMDPLPAPPRLHHPSKPWSLPWRLPALPAPPAMTADSARIGDLEVRAASLIGPGHRSDSAHAAPRQDAYRMGRDSRSQYLIAAVADGMSDSAHSEVAAAVAVAALVNTLRTQLDAGAVPETLDCRDVFLDAARQVYGAAQQRGWSDEEVRTVAAAAVMPTRPHASGARRMWLAGVGDASGWFRGTEEWHLLLGHKEGGFDQGRVRAYLPHTPDHARSRVYDLGPSGLLALTTDGVGDALAQLPGAARWFHRQWAEPVGAHDLLLHIGFEAQQRNDDRTAVLVWWRAPGDTR